jgi:hypothetical protein
LSSKSRRKRATEESEKSGNSRWPLWLLAGIILLVSMVRLRLLDMPLERDEGEYAYAGQLILQGMPPYASVYAMKLPGTYAAYAVVMLAFGQSPSGIHAGLAVVAAVTIFLIYLLGARLFGPPGGLIAAASFALTSTVPTILGFAGHATHFVVLPAVAGVLLLLKALDEKKPFLFFVSGGALGLAFVMKQPGIFFVLFGMVYTLVALRKSGQNEGHQGRLLSIAALLAGCGLPFAATCLALWRAGVFPQFWFWTFTYARQYGSIVSLLDASGLFWDTLPQVVGSALWIWVIAAIGLSTFFWSAKARPHMVFLTMFFLFSFLAVCTGWYFRSHYFILLLPAVSLLVAMGVEAARDSRFLLNRSLGKAPVVAFLIAGAWCIARESAFLFSMSPHEAARSLYSANPFPEAEKIGDYLRQHTAPGDRIAVLGSEPEIYFYARRRAATGFIYAYPLMEDQEFAGRMQAQMISEIEAVNPAFLVLVDVPYSWLRRPNSDPAIFNWFDKYRSNYELAGIADIMQDTQYRWDAEAKTYQPLSPFTVRIFRRK